MALTREALANLQVPAVRILEDGTEQQTVTALDSNEKISAAIPDGVWRHANFRDALTGRDGEQAASFQWVGGRFHPERYGKSWALTLLVSWDLTDEKQNLLPCSETGWYMLPPAVQDAIAGTIAVWRDEITFPTLDKPLTIR